MLNDGKQWHVQNAIPAHKIYVKCFPGAKSSDMRDYIKPTMRHDPNLVLLHFGTNNLKSDQTPPEVADDIIDIAFSIKNENNDIVVPSITRRDDSFNNIANYRCTGDFFW